MAEMQVSLHVEIKFNMTRPILFSFLTIVIILYRIVDGTWHLPLWKRDAEAEYLR